MAVVSLTKKEYEVLKSKAEKYDRFILRSPEEEKTKKRFNIKELIKGFSGKEKEFWNYPPVGKEAW